MQVVKQSVPKKSIKLEIADSFIICITKVWGWWHLKSPSMMAFFHGNLGGKRLIFYCKVLLMWITRKPHFWGKLKFLVCLLCEDTYLCLNEKADAYITNAINHRKEDVSPVSLGSCMSTVVLSGIETEKTLKKLLKTKWY